MKKSKRSGSASALHEGSLSRDRIGRPRSHFQLSRKRSPSGAHNVLRAIHSAINLIAESPLSARQSTDPDIRVKVVDRYGYKIFYTPGTDTIEILHIRHG